MYSFSGIGSRSTPESIIEVIENITNTLRSGTLRTGGASGADQFFINAAIRFGVVTEVFLPWASFEEDFINTVYKNKLIKVYNSPSLEAYEVAEQFHPGWKYLKPGAKALHARNSHQVLGWSLDDPVSVVICWTPNGDNSKGGTSQAIRIAEHYNIPVINLGETYDQ